MGNEEQSLKYEYYNYNYDKLNEIEVSKNDEPNLLSLTYNKNIDHLNEDYNLLYWIIYDDDLDNTLLIIKKTIYLDVLNLFAGPFNNDAELNDFLNQIKTLNYNIEIED